MNCSNLTEDGLECGSDEGIVCDECAQREMREHAYLRNLSFGAVTGKMSAEDERHIREAGRGHLLP